MHILNKRSDGYHNLQTIFQLIDYCDTLTFTKRDDGAIKRIGDNHNIPPENDLIIKSAIFLQKLSKTHFGVDIKIDKKIPIGSGLGGGSSNAATVLMALNQLWQLNLTQNKLKEIGLKLGADVPFFIHNRTALAEGIGEKFTDIDLPNYWFLVINPNQSISTAEVFNHPDLSHSLPIKFNNLSALRQTKNDCLAVSAKLCPEINQIITWLNHLDTTILNWSENLVVFLNQPRLSGTGASVFIAGQHKEPLEKAKKICPKQWLSFVAKSITYQANHLIQKS